MSDSHVPKILLVDDEEPIHLVFEEIASEHGFDLDCELSAEAALERLKSESYDLAIVDKNLPGLSGLELIRILRGVHIDMKVVMITGFGSYDSAVEALRLGAIDYIEKPFGDLELVGGKIKRALEGSDSEALRAQLAGLKRAIEAAFVPLGQVDAQLEHLVNEGGADATALKTVRQTVKQLRDLLVMSLGEARGGP